MLVQVRTTSIFSQNVTDALVIFPEPPRMFSHAFILMTIKKKSCHLHHQNPNHATYGTPPFLHTRENVSWPAVDWKENAIPATTRRHKQLVINTGSSPRRSQGDAIPSPPRPGPKNAHGGLEKIDFFVGSRVWGSSFFSGNRWKIGLSLFFFFWGGGGLYSDLWGNFRGEGFSLGFLVGEDDMLDGGMVYRYIQ